MALCPDLIDPPQNASIEKQWSMWGKDRDEYRNCQSLNKAKAGVIKAILKQ